ncbi:MAG TPA: hypothetical protein VL334_25980 [Anaerolineae bacterium]|nr:hypothetical protein [Anaerolineae bacterium]
MKIDAQLYRQALAEYRQWNDAEMKARAREASLRQSDAGWKEFNALWSFARLVGAKQSPMQRKQKLEAIDLYYERVKKLEAWRQEHGRTA